jgi:glycosyltransferase involved in cell wall biosynthesis
MKDLAISIALCTYNGSRFLPEQLESIASQKRLPDELVLCDDCSDDNTIDILESFARRVSFAVRLEKNSNNLGCTRNFEKAIRLCRGQIIVLSDQDDEWYPTKLQRMAEIFFSSPDTIAVFSNAELMDENSARLPGTLWDSFFFNTNQQRRFEEGHSLAVLLKHPVVTGATMAFRAQYREFLMPIAANLPHDYWISFLLASRGRVKPIPEFLLRYRRHAGQQIGPGLANDSMQALTIARNTGRRWYDREIECLSQVLEHLKSRASELPDAAGTIELFRRKIAHRSIRANLQQSKISRIPAVLREASNLGYWRFSEGWRSLAKDLLLSTSDNRG